MNNLERTSVSIEFPEANLVVETTIGKATAGVAEVVPVELDPDKFILGED